MLFGQFYNLLPKKYADGVAPKTPASQHQLLRLGVFKKLSKILHFFKLSRLSLGVVVVFYLLGYQPTLAIPPIRRAIVKADFSASQTINAGSFTESFILPHPGYISTYFSTWHPGIDIATGLGMPIHPIASGKVIDATYGFFGLGHSVTIEHEQGFKSTYGHMGRIFVKKDDQITQNSIIGEVGMTGHTTGPHTHLEVAKEDKYLDPQTILPALPDWPKTAGPLPQGQRNLSQAIQPTPVKSGPIPTPTPKIVAFDLGKIGQPEVKTADLSKLSRLLMSPLVPNVPQIVPVPD